MTCKFSWEIEKAPASFQPAEATTQPLTNGESQRSCSLLCLRGTEKLPEFVDLGKLGKLPQSNLSRVWLDTHWLVDALDVPDLRLRAALRRTKYKPLSIITDVRYVRSGWHYDALIRHNGKLWLNETLWKKLLSDLYVRRPYLPLLRAYAHDKR